MFQLCKNQVIGLVFTGKIFEKRLWKSDIFNKDAGPSNVTLPQVFFEHFASKSQLSVFYIIGTLVENGLKCLRCQNTRTNWIYKNLDI